MFKTILETQVIGTPILKKKNNEVEKIWLNIKVGEGSNNTEVCFQIAKMCANEENRKVFNLLAGQI